MSDPNESPDLFVPLRHRELEERASLIVDGDRVVKNRHHFVAVVDGELVHDPDAPLPKRDEALVRAELHDLARGRCACTGWRCTSCLARREIAAKRGRVIMITFPEATSADEVIHLQAEQELIEGFDGPTIPVICPLSVPYPASASHAGQAAINERVARFRLAALDLATELYVHNVDGRVDPHMARDIEYAELTGKPIRWLTPPRELCRMCHVAVEPTDNPVVHGDGFAHPACAHLTPTREGGCA